MINQDQTFNLSTYLSHIGFNQTASLQDIKPTYDTLLEITTLHSMTFNYQNQNIFRTREQMPMSLDHIWDRVGNKRLGGMCYELTQILMFVLESIGFKAERIPTYVLNNQPFKPELPSLHNIIFVAIGDDKYLIDISFGYNLIREPLKFSFAKTEEFVTSQNEKYQLFCADDHYVLSMEIKGQFATFYRFNRIQNTDLPEFVSSEQSIRNYLGLLSSEKQLTIRDHTLKVGKLTKNGRIGYVYLTLDQTMKKLEMIGGGEAVTTKFVDIKEFIQDITTNTGIILLEEAIQRPSLV